MFESSEMATLYSFFNSSAAYRVRIALNLKGIDFETTGINIRTGEQHGKAYKARNLAGLVPTFVQGDLSITQSLAIIEYLDELRPEPRLVPGVGPLRARVFEIAHLIACDIHPLNNLRVLKYLTEAFGASKEQKTLWVHHWLANGFSALEGMLPDDGGWCVGSAPTLADCCLVPQVANARRAGLDLTPYPRVVRIDAQCQAHPAFVASRPEAQPDFIPA